MPKPQKKPSNENNELSPPFRILKPRHVELCSKSYQCPTALRGPIKRFMEKYPISKPPVFFNLKKQYELSIHELHKKQDVEVKDIPKSLIEHDVYEILESYRHFLLDIAEAAPVSYYEAISYIKDTIEKDLSHNDSIKTENIQIETHGSGFSNPSSMVKMFQSYQRAMEELVWKYLHTREQGLGETIRKTVPLLAIYDSSKGIKDKNLMEKLYNARLEEFSLIEILHTVLYERIENIGKNVFRDTLPRFMDKIKASVARTVSVPNVIRSFNDIAREAHKIEHFAAAEFKLQKFPTVFKDILPEKEHRKLESIIQNFLDKMRLFNDIFTQWFGGKELDTLYRYLLPLCVNKHSAYTPIGKSVNFTLYPCKDYNELSKGHFSSDCTTDFSLAADHLLEPAFFNVRIFRNSRWIGNIYMLDFSEKHRILVMDRIQLSRMNQFLPQKIFPNFLKAVVNEFTEPHGLKLYAPYEISNFQSVQDSYNRYIALVKKKKNNLPIPDSFESSDSKYLYRLN